MEPMAVRSTRKTITHIAGACSAALLAMALMLLIGPLATAHAESPNLTITSPGNGSISKETNPTFSGSTEDLLDNVTVTVYSGTSVGGTQVGSESTALPPALGTWSIGPVATLPDGVYTAQATQRNALSELVGSSEGVTFTVDTAPPRGTLNGITSPTGDTTPLFSGEASDHTTVVVHIKNSEGGEETGTASGTGGGWSTENESGLASGSYTAYATQSSSLGNEEGHSNTISFTVETHPPSVSLSSISSPTKDNTPSFSGEASDHTQVVVHIFNSSHTEVSKAFASGNGGGWSSGVASPSLADGQ